MSARVVFWQNIPSIHQAPLIREIASEWGREVIVVAERDVPEERLAQGWTRPDFGDARLIVQPTDEERRKLIGSAGHGDVHIFSGFHAYPATYRALKAVARTPATIGVFAEPRSLQPRLKSVLRRVRYRTHAVRFGRRLAFLLVTGALGERYYRACGFGADCIVPFGYFVEDVNVVSGSVPGGADRSEYEDRSVRLLFVGQLARHKGLDLLLQSLATSGVDDWRLDVIGGGPDAEQLKALAHELNLGARIRWMGARPNGEVRSAMAHADALVLPSRHDGWGAVVNEALMAGARAVVSDACGACDLVREQWRGAIFRAGSVTSLSNAVREVVCRGKISDEDRSRIRAWARRTISPRVAAKYLIDIFEYAKGNAPRPVPPWRVSSTSEGEAVGAVDVTGNKP